MYELTVMAFVCENHKQYKYIVKEKLRVVGVNKIVRNVRITLWRLRLTVSATEIQQCVMFIAALHKSLPTA
jgi:hypothetical protein